MDYYLELAAQKRIGPYSADEIFRLRRDALIGDDTLVYAGPESEGSPLGVWAEEMFVAGPTMDRADRADPASPAQLISREAPRTPNLAVRTREGLRALQPHLFVPWEQLSHRQWMGSTKLLLVAAIGLLPLLLISMLSGEQDVRGAYWAIAYYFSGLWAVFFYAVFPSPNVSWVRCLICFFGTGGLSVSVLFLAYQLPPLKTMVSWVMADAFGLRWVGFIMAVGLPEEVCKVLVLAAMLQVSRPLPPQTVLFYGLISGLGFGIYEGVDYQKWRNWVFAEGNAGEYYLLNVLRLTTLPFLHAIWSGIAGYFLGFASVYPRHRLGLMIVAIGIPAFLQGTYNALGASYAGVGVALLSVLALNLYLAKSKDFEDVLDQPPS